MTTIGIDVDGVLRDFCTGLEKVVKEHYPEYLPEDYTGINNWKLSDNFIADKADLQKIYWDEYAKEIMGESPAFEENVRQMKNLTLTYLIPCQLINTLDLNMDIYLIDLSVLKP